MLKKSNLSIIALLFLTIATTGCGANGTPIPTAEDNMTALELQAQKLLEELKPLIKEDKFGKMKIKTLALKGYLINKNEMGILAMIAIDLMGTLDPNKTKADEIAPFTIELHIEDLKAALKRYGTDEWMDGSNYQSADDKNMYAYFKDDKIKEGLEKEIELHEVFKKMIDLKIGLIKPEDVKKSAA